MSQKFYFYIPRTPQVADLFAAHQLTFEFCREVESRQEFQDYCQWYEETAARHQEELKTPYSLFPQT